MGTASLFRLELCLIQLIYRYETKQDEVTEGEIKSLAVAFTFLPPKDWRDADVKIISNIQSRRRRSVRRVASNQTRCGCAKCPACGFEVGWIKRCKRCDYILSRGFETLNRDWGNSKTQHPWRPCSVCSSHRVRLMLRMDSTSWKQESPLSRN